MTRWLALMLLFLTGCGAKAATTATTIQIKTNEQTNHGAPFYAVVKATDYSNFLVDDYQKIAAEATTGKENPALLDVAHFIPGETKTLQVEAPKDKAVAVYFIFTRPGEEWKFLTDEKEGNKVKILLGKSEIKSARAF